MCSLWFNDVFILHSQKHAELARTDRSDEQGCKQLSRDDSRHLTGCNQLRHNVFQ